MDKSKIFALVMPWHISERGGGAEVQANYLAKELAERGFRVFYICQTINPNRINTFETLEGVTIFWLKPSGRFQWIDQQKYYKALKKIRPQIVIQRLSSNVTYEIGKYCRESNAAFHWICTDNLSPYKDFHTRKYKEKNSMNEIGVLKYSAFSFNAFMMDFYRNKGMNSITKAFSQNKIQKELLKRQFDLSTSKMISGHPVPKTTIPTEERFNKKNVLWVANFGRHKRPELFIELARRLESTGIEFTMVGGHSDSLYMNDLLKNKPKNLQTTGLLSFEDALSHFNEATLFINTSAPGGDGFPNTFVQSWLRGVPVLSLGFDPDDIIVENQLGFSLKSINAMTEKIENILSDSVRYSFLSRNVYNYALKNHTVEAMADNFLKEIEI